MGDTVFQGDATNLPTSGPPGSMPESAGVPASEDLRSVGGEPAELFEQMLRIRVFEERCVELYSAGQIRGFMHLGVGQEAAAVGVVGALGDTDRVVGTYREHAHALAKGVPPESVMAEMFGFREGCSGGRGGSMHLFDVQRGFFGGNAIVAGGLPLAVGLALGDTMAGSDRITACFFGDGAMAEGEFHEAVNLAALWGLPVLFCCENNLYAMGTGLGFTHAATDLALRASSYGMVSWAVDAMDVVATRRAAVQAIAGIRGGAGPHFLELRTYRLRAHSMYDPERYRSADEVARWRERDPVAVMRSDVLASGALSATEVEALENRVERWVDTAVEQASAGTPEPVGDLERHVVADSGW